MGMGDNKKKRILIIDDEEVFCQMVKANLERLGDYEVLFAYNGREGLKITVEQPMDLILLDLIMPGANGLEILRALKENPKTLAIPVLMLTAVSNELAQQESTAWYSDGYLEKPIEIAALQAKIENVLSRQVGRHS